MSIINPSATLQTPNLDAEATRFIDEWVRQSQQVRDHFEPQWDENWANYRVEPFRVNYRDIAKTNPYATAGIIDSRDNTIRLKTPECHQIANTLHTSIMRSIWGNRNPVQAEPVGDEDVDAARKVSELIMYGLERPGGYMCDYIASRDAIVFGTGTYGTMWKTEIRTVPQRVQIPDQETGQPMVDPQTGAPISALTNAPKAVYDDIFRWPISPYDVWFDVSATTIQAGEGIVTRFRMSSDELAGKANQPGWVSEGITKVLSMSPNQWATGGSGKENAKLFIDGLTREDIKAIADYGYYGGWEFVGRCPSSLARKLGLDPSISYFLSIINGIIVRLGQNPQYKAEVPYGTYTVLPTGGTIYGLSPLTVIRYLQDVSDTELILSVQAMLESVYQNYLVGGAAGVGPGFNRLLQNRRPRQVFTVPGDVTQIAPLVRDYAGLQMAAQSLGMLSQTMRDASNARDPVQGIQSNDRSTATEINTVASAAMANVGLLNMPIEREELTRLADLIYGLYYINLDDEGKVIKRVGSQESTTVAFADIDRDFDIIFAGSDQTVSRQQKASEFMQFTQMVLASPMGQASFDFNAAEDYYCKNIAETKGLMGLIVKNPNEVIARMQVMGMKGPLGGPGGSSPPANSGSTGTVP